MGHEVYICYDEKDQITADAICHVMEENKIKCWLKTRDLGVNHIVDGIMEAINESKVMVLIFSSNSKNSNFVNTEVDIAFTENIPILVFKIDESKLDGGLEFFLNNKHWLDAYPNPEVKFESLIRDTSKLLGKPISKPVIHGEKSLVDPESIRQHLEGKNVDKPIRAVADSGDEPKTAETVSDPDVVESRGRIPEPVKEAPKPVKEQKVAEPVGGDSVPITPPSFMNRFKIPIIVGVILLLAVGAFAFMSFNGNGSTADIPSNVTIKISDFSVDKASGGYSYSVVGSVSPDIGDANKYVLTSYFYDKVGNLVNSTQINLNDAKQVDKGMLLGSTVSDSKDIVRVEVKLESNDVIVAQSESQL